MYLRFGKRALDLALTLPAFIVVTPLLLLVALLIRLDSPGPALFTQDRLGRHGRVFRILKFRTMTNRERVPDKDIFGHHPEVTRVGYWLRRFKLDELPQLLNVLRGDMTLVGPRPYLPRQLSMYDEQSRRRLDVPPGLTGLAQVNGNIHLSWEERWAFDVVYVDHCSLWLDLRIIARTLFVIALGEERFHRPLDVAVNEERLKRALSPGSSSESRASSD